MVVTVWTGSGLKVTGEAELSSLLAGQQPPPPVLAHSLPPLPGTGPGRLLTLNTPATLQHCVDCTKELLGLDMVRLGLATGHLMDTKVRVRSDGLLFMFVVTAGEKYRGMRWSGSECGGRQ